MQRRQLGRTDVQVSVVGIGTWQMGGPDTSDGIGHGWGDVDDDRSIRIIHRAEELGVNLIDTADSYGRGRSEEVVGRALQGRRERWIVATKVGRIKEPEKRGEYRDYAGRHIREGCEASLRRLRTDHIDIYQLHGHPDDHQMSDAMEELAKLRDAGKIRFYGVSTGSVEAIEKLNSFGPLHVAQIGLNLLNRSEEPALDYCDQQGIGTLIRTPLAWGAAFGRYAIEKPPEFEFGDNRHGRDPRELSQEHRQGLTFSFLWEGTGRTPAQAALRFVLDQPGVTAVIPGTKKMEHLEENVRAAEISPLTEEERNRVEEATATWLQ